MKLLWLVPPAMNIETIVRSIPKEWGCESDIQFLGDEVFYTTQYDLAIYTGATEGKYSLPIDTLKQLRSQTKTLFISCAGGDLNWHPLLERYAKEDVFDLVVNIDGFFDWPKRGHDLTLIGCVDPTPYEIKTKKDIQLGANMASHSNRDHFIEHLNGLVTMGLRTESFGNHDDFSNFIRRCHCFLNMNWVDEGAPAMGLNMKILEAGLAGCVLLEKKDSVTSRWFIPFMDYLPYTSVEDVKNFMNRRLEDFDHIVYNLHAKVRIKYSNTIFWTTVFNALGLRVS